MSRAIIVATIVTSILTFSSPSLAASDEEIAHLGDKMSGAFRCAIYAGMSKDFKEQKRLFQIGLNAGRDYVEGMKSNQLGEYKEYLGDVSTDFVVGMMYKDLSDKADHEVRKYRDGQMRERWRDSDAVKLEAERRYRDGNCSLIQ
jgi:hypothetical protein